MVDTPKKNTLFLHLNLPDPFWRPSKQESEEDRPLAIMKITSTRSNRVYFTYVDSRTGKAEFSMTVDNWNAHYADTTQILQ